MSVPSIPCQYHPFHVSTIHSMSVPSIPCPSTANSTAQCCQQHCLVLPTVQFSTANSPVQHRQQPSPALSSPVLPNTAQFCPTLSSSAQHCPVLPNTVQSSSQQSSPGLSTVQYWPVKKSQKSHQSRCEFVSAGGEVTAQLFDPTTRPKRHRQFFSFVSFSARRESFASHFCLPRGREKEGEKRPTSGKKWETSALNWLMKSMPRQPLEGLRKTQRKGGIF